MDRPQVRMFSLLLTLVFLLSGWATSEVMTHQGAWNLSSEGEQISNQLFESVKTRTLQGVNDQEARRQLQGICETLRNLRSEFSTGMIVPRKNLLLLDKCRSLFEPVSPALPLDGHERAELKRLMQILDALRDYARQHRVAVSQPVAPPISTTEIPPTSPLEELSPVTPSTGQAPSWCRYEAQGEVIVKEVSAPGPLPAGVRALTPCVEVQPGETGEVRELRLTPQQPLSPGQNVAMAFYSEASGRWLTHAAHYDQATNQIVARTNHASIWRAVTDSLIRSSKENSHFRVHYYASQVTDADAQDLLNRLENSRRHLQTLGLILVKKQMDVYLSDLGAGADFKYGGHALGLLSEFMEINLPARLKSLGPGVYQATLVHELFHDVQLVTYERLNSPLARNVEYRRRKRGVFAYGMLNEALSTWVELNMLHHKGFPPERALLYAYSPSFHSGGLKNTNPDAGYGGGYFIDFLVRIYGKELIGSILGACYQQGPVSTRMGQGVVYNTRRNGFKALKRGVEVRSQALGLNDSLEELWMRYVQQLTSYQLKGLDPRVDRKKLLLSGRKEPFWEGRTATYNDRINPLSVGRVLPIEVTKGGSAVSSVKVTVKQDVSGGDVKVRTLLYIAPGLGRLKENALLTSGAKEVTDIIGSGRRSGNVTFQPGQQKAVILVVPVGLNGYHPSDLRIEVSCEAAGSQQVTQPQAQPTAAVQGNYHPTVTQVSPSEAGVNQVVTIHGSGFGPAPANLPRKLTLIGGTAVVFRTSIVGKPAEVAAHVLSWSDTAITVRVPPANYGYSPIQVGVYRERVGSNFVPFKLKE